MTLTAFPNGISSRGMPVISPNGLDLLTFGSVFFVDSNNGSDSNNEGTDPSRPFATIAYAVAKCTAGKKDIIFVMPGHNEGFGDAQLDIDVDDVMIIGVGNGSSRPRIDFDHANASINIAADNVVLANITLLPSATDVLIAIDVEAGQVNTQIVDVEALPGEDGAGVDDFALVVDIKAGCDNTKVHNLRVRQHASGAGYIAAVKLTGASDSVEISGLDAAMSGAALVAPINGDTTLSTNLTIKDCILITDGEPGVELLTGTTGVSVNVMVYAPGGTLAGAVAGDAIGWLETYAADTANQSAAIVRTAST